ncbi:Ppx/GppA phosphatase family protein [Hippea jasoniae]|uniref:Ppx/GppA phosphatase family protein n=1 Tax=Hippea jasoniae TaxID=944479 RepID=UPI00054EE4FE|nr:hypothetical protein [Hippea jasoniae]
MRAASIDIGTNTIRLAIVEKDKNCNFKFLLRKGKIARLGEDIAKTHLLKPQAIDRAIAVLKQYKAIIDSYKVEKVFCLATSATREAENSELFINKAKELGFDIEIIDGKKEAFLTHLCIIYFLREVLANKSWVAVDIGGGSTEFIFSRGFELIDSFSVPLGVVKLLEMFIRHDPPQESELNEACDYFIDNLKRFVKSDFNIDCFVANAGTPTTLAAIKLGLVEYDYYATEGLELSKDFIEKIIDEMLKYNSDKLLEVYPILQKGREDVIVLGAYLLKRLLEFFGMESVVVTNGSLREGIFIERLCDG